MSSAFDGHSHSELALGLPVGSGQRPEASPDKGLRPGPLPGRQVVGGLGSAFSLVRGAGTHSHPALESHRPGELAPVCVYLSPPSPSFIHPLDVYTWDTHRHLRLNENLPCFAGNGTSAHPLLKSESRICLILSPGSPQVPPRQWPSGAGLLSARGPNSLFT